MPKSGNCFADLPERLAEEAFTTLASFPGARIERIVSTGQASPPGFWYDQDGPEWVILLAGSAGLLFEGEDDPRILAPGDYIEIPPRSGIASNGPMRAVRRCGWRFMANSGAPWKMNPCAEQARCAGSRNPP